MKAAFLHLIAGLFFFKIGYKSAVSLYNNLKQGAGHFYESKTQFSSFLAL